MFSDKPKTTFLALLGFIPDPVLIEAVGLTPKDVPPNPTWIQMAEKGVGGSAVVSASSYLLI